MNDTERLDALETYGLCVASHDALRHGQWTRLWVCTYDVNKCVIGGSIRDVIDAAVLDITTGIEKAH
jgi:hypothetical protein